MSIAEMKEVCRRTDASFIVTGEDEKMSNIYTGSGETVHFMTLARTDTSWKRHILPLIPIIQNGAPLCLQSAGTAIRRICRIKDQKIVSLAASSQSDVNLISDARIESNRENM